MYRDKKRFGQNPAVVARSADATWFAPMKWNQPATVFVCSWSDFFIKDADPWRDDAWYIMKRTPWLTYLILTKRPENIQGRWPVGHPLKNVWLGVTAENQKQLDTRLPILLEHWLRASFQKVFVSIEPMLEPVNIVRYGHFIDWVIVGGESGPGARKMPILWAADVKRNCKQFKIPFFMKQMSGPTKAHRENIPAVLRCQQVPRGW